MTGRIPIGYAGQRAGARNGKSESDDRRPLRSHRRAHPTISTRIPARDGFAVRRHALSITPDKPQGGRCTGSAGRVAGGRLIVVISDRRQGAWSIKHLPIKILIAQAILFLPARLLPSINNSDPFADWRNCGSAPLLLAALRQQANSNPEKHSPPKGIVPRDVHQPVIDLLGKIAQIHGPGLQCW